MTFPFRKGQRVTQPGSVKPQSLEQHLVDDGLGSADAWDQHHWGHPGATEHPETVANQNASGHAESGARSQIGDQPRAAVSAVADS